MEGGGKKPEKIKITVTILKGEGLAAKDRNFFGRKTTSDPYVEVWIEEGGAASSNKMIGKTRTIQKTLNPKWTIEESFQLSCNPTTAGHTDQDGGDCTHHSMVIVLKIWDEDLMSAPDAMGTIRIPINPNDLTGEFRESTSWYDVPPDSAKNASGRLQVRIQECVNYYSRALIRGNTFPLFRAPIQLGLAWDMIDNTREVDLDLSCVALSTTGQILLQDTVYYGNRFNSNESVIHSGDEREGDEIGDDERINILLEQVPPHVLAMYIIVTVVTPDLRLCDVKSATLRVYNTAQENLTFCSFTPAIRGQDATAMFMARIARSRSSKWVLATIEDTHPTARDFGSLVPYLKSYTTDLIPNLQVDPTERVAILQKGGTIRLADYSPGGKIPEKITFGLAWDVTNGVNIDLDASVLLLNDDLELVDQVWFSQLDSNDKSIHHHGDEREGDEVGDDEKIDLQLSEVSSAVKYIVFMINSYSGQELDDVDRAACHIFDSATNIEMASYAMTNTKAVDGHTALIVACLFRGPSGNWNLSLVARPTQGKVAKDALGAVKDHLRNNPPAVPNNEEDIEIVVGSEMPSRVPLVEAEIVL